MKRRSSLGVDGKPPELWLFDFDRTLAILEPEVDWNASRRSLEAELGVSAIPRELLSHLLVAIPRGNLALYEALRARLLDGPESCRPIPDLAQARAILACASAVIERYELAGVDRAAPTGGAKETLQVLSAREIAAAIVTSNSARTVSRWLELHRLDAYLRVIVGRDSGLALKPSPAMVERARELCAGTKLEQVVFVGDSEADLRAARAAGIRFAGIAADHERRARLIAAGVDEIFESPGDLAAQFGLK